MSENYSQESLKYADSEKNEKVFETCTDLDLSFLLPTVNFESEELLNFKEMLGEISLHVQNEPCLEEIAEIKNLLNEFKNKILDKSSQISDKKLQISKLFTVLHDKN
jgi:hypothetical protein